MFLMDAGLVRHGHQSIVIAAMGSQISGELIETPVYRGEITDEVRESAQQAHLRCLERALDRYSVDLVHFHGLDFYSYLPERSTPRVATLHLPLDWYPSFIFDMRDIQLVCVSQAQAAGVSGKELPFIGNGIDTRQFQQETKTRDFLLWLGRICPEKGVHIALQVAHRLELPMIVAGPVHPFQYHRDYFAHYVESLLDADRQYVGSVKLAEKKKLLAEARCVLIPSLVPETSSLVAMESISSGTPVIAFRSGALPEIVEHGQTGFIVDSEEEMANAVMRVSEISRETCRERAKVRFDVERMLEKYTTLYTKAIKKHSSESVA